MIKKINYKTALLAIFVFALLVTISSNQDRETSYSGEKRSKAPEFTLENLMGETVTLKEYAGKYVLVNFWATWCGPCVMEMPSLEKLYNTIKGDRFEILAISIDREDKQAIQQFAKEHAITFPVLLDTQGSVSSSYRVLSIPISYLIDPTGHIVSKIMGYREWDSKESIAFFNDLL